MKSIIDNWYLVVALLATIVVVAGAVYKFFNMPSEEQKKKVKEWLIWACIEAEKALESGTGQLKLRKVYDAFIAVPSFSWIAKMVSFDTFSEWVTEALEKAKTMIVNNPDLARYVYGEDVTNQIIKLKEQLGL